MTTQIIFENNYDTNQVTRLTLDQLNQKINSFEREMTIEKASGRVHYFNIEANKEQKMSTLFEVLNVSDDNTVVYHFDSECDVYVVTCQ